MIEPLGPDLTQLTFQGSYTPPLGLPGRLLDRWVLHRVAEANVKNLVDRIAKALRESFHPEQGWPSEGLMRLRQRTVSPRD